MGERDDERPPYAYIATPDGILYVEGKPVARMNTKKRKDERAWREQEEARLNEEGLGGYVNLDGSVSYVPRHESLPDDFTTNPTHPVHQPKRPTPPGSDVITDQPKLKHTWVYGAVAYPPYQGRYYDPSQAGQADVVRDEQGYVRSFQTPDGANHALWNEYARKMDNGETYVHEEDWHTFPGASPAEVLGESD